jgi:predicted NAD/FAD-binding protein
MAKVAIIGTGIAGLAAAWRLHPDHDIVVYEKAPRIGGHTRTLEVRHGDRDIAVDTGFIVFNDRNYPRLTRLFRDLDVAVQESDMSFALTVRDGWLEWGAHSLDAIFGQRRNLARPAFHRLFADVMRFNAGAVRAVEADPDCSLGELIARMRLGQWFRRYYLLPMAGAIWSAPPTKMLEFPAASFVRFFDNHGLLSLTGQPQWYTVTGGAQNYVRRMTAPFADRIRTGCAAVEIRRTAAGVRIRDRSGALETYDQVVLACHADEALGLLADPTRDEQSALGAFSYQRNRAILHRDPRFMPRRPRCWASWVYHSDGNGDEAAITVSYWMNRLQSIDPAYPLFVTLNPAQDIPDEMVFNSHDFTHPVFNRAAVGAQARVRKIQGSTNTWYCGAYLGYGFHEDGLASGLDVADALSVVVRHAQPRHAMRRAMAAE